jgi:hypothetical protein
MFIFIVNKYFMNVLILTPDRVGSTLLQRLITVYMQAHDYGAPVINLHELTNGLIKYYSPMFAREVLGKPNGQPWGYFQSLDQITDLLLLEQLGYEHYWNPAEKKGYSGTAIFTKISPKHVEYESTHAPRKCRVSCCSAKY